MGFLRRVFGGPKAPAWASFMTGVQYASFETVLHADLRARGWRFEQREDGLFVDRGGEQPVVYGLTNIAQLCAAIEPADWATAVRDHFDHIASGPGDRDEGMTWADVASLVKPRVYPAAFAQHMDLPPFPMCPELAAAIAIDYPTTVVTPQRDAASDWPASDEVFATALANLRREGLSGPESVDVGGASVLFFMGDSFFTAGHLLRLREFPEMAGREHALVAVPTRHALVLHPIEDLRVLKVVGPMAAIAGKACESGPGSIVPDLFWWHGGALTRIPVILHGERTNVIPPDAFVELLNSLPEAPGT
jgi:hypothetical protein